MKLHELKAVKVHVVYVTALAVVFGSGNGKTSGRGQKVKKHVQVVA